jgi:hypothetical protein
MRQHCPSVSKLFALGFQQEAQFTVVHHFLKQTVWSIKASVQKDPNDMRVMAGSEDSGERSVPFDLNRSNYMGVPILIVGNNVKCVFEMSR